MLSSFNKKIQPHLCIQSITVNLFKSIKNKIYFKDINIFIPKGHMKLPMLQKIYISNKCCSFKLSSKNPEKVSHIFPHK